MNKMEKMNKDRLDKINKALKGLSQQDAYDLICYYKNKFKDIYPTVIDKD